MDRPAPRPHGPTARQPAQPRSQWIRAGKRQPPRHPARQGIPGVGVSLGYGVVTPQPESTIRGSDDRYGRGLRALVALGDGVGDRLVLLQRAVAARLDLREVNEHIGATTIWGDEAEALLSVEPLDGALCHESLLTTFRFTPQQRAVARASRRFRPCSDCDVVRRPRIAAISWDRHDTNSRTTNHH